MYTIITKELWDNSQRNHQSQQIAVNNIENCMNQYIRECDLDKLCFSKKSREFLFDEENSDFFNVNYFEAKAIILYQIISSILDNKQIYSLLNQVYNTSLINCIIYINEYIKNDVKNHYVIVFKNDIALLWTPFINERISFYKYSNMSVNTVSVEYPIKGHAFSKEYLYSIAYKYMTGEFRNINNWTVVQKLKIGGVQINGTACVGKTTILHKLKSDLKSLYNRDVNIEKPSKFGSFHNKDSNMLSALQLQVINNDYTLERSHTSLFDRDKYNNIYWRYILALFDQELYNNKDAVVLRFVEMFYYTFLPSVLEIMKRQPIIFLLNSNTQSVKFQMSCRCTNKDLYRSKIPLYVEIQNMVYGVIGELCNYWIINMAQNSFESVNKQLVTPINVKLDIETRIKSLVESDNNKYHVEGEHLNVYYFKPHHTINAPEFNNIQYEGAKTLKIFK